MFTGKPPLFSAQPAFPRCLFHSIKMRDHREHAAHPRLVIFQSIMEVAPAMSPAAYLHQPAVRVGEEAVVDHIRVGLQISSEILQECFRPRALPRRRVVKDRARMIPISDIWPDSPLPGVGNFRSSTFTGVSSVPTTFEDSIKSFRHR